MTAACRARHWLHFRTLRSPYVMCVVRAEHLLRGSPSQSADLQTTAVAAGNAPAHQGGGHAASGAFARIRELIVRYRFAKRPRISPEGLGLFAVAPKALSLAATKASQLPS